MKKSLALLFTLFFFASCGQKASVPTNFELALSSVQSGGAAFNGGIILMGKNGSDRFQVGLNPSNIDGFSLELPSGDWEFVTVGWNTDTPVVGNGPPIMAGEPRCAYTTSKIENEESTVSLNMNFEKCQDGFVAGANEVYLDKFNELYLNSCLTLGEVNGLANCEGFTNQDQPGETVSLRVVFPGEASFGGRPSSLKSRCINASGINQTPQNLKNGLIKTGLYLPHNGTHKFPWALEAFTKTNCQGELHALYQIKDGLMGSEGVARKSDDSAEGFVRISFADNITGYLNSLFSASNSAFVFTPKIDCENDCFVKDQANDYQLPSGSAQIHKRLWRYLGNALRVDPDDIKGDIAALTPTNGSMEIRANKLGSVGNGTMITFLNTLNVGTEPTINECTQESLSVEYSIATPDLTTTQQIVEAINAGCGMHFQAQKTDGFTYPNDNGPLNASYNLGGGFDRNMPRERFSGKLHRISQLLMGPVGSLLYENDIVDFASFCAISEKSVSFSLPDQFAKIEISSIGAGASLPAFIDDSKDFEKKMLISLDGFPSEVFYFRCTDKESTGSYVSIENEGAGEIYHEQVYWGDDGTDKWIEAAQKTTVSNTVTKQDYFLLQSTNMTDWSYWSLSSDAAGFNLKSLGLSSNGTGALEVQGYFVSDIDNNTTFDSNSGFEKFDIYTGSYSTTTSPTYPNPTVLPTLIDNYDMASFLASDNFWDFNTP